MSSHHIVREKQEPALLITGLDHFSEEMLGQLLEWSPTVIVTDDIAEKVNAWGIKIDWLITDNTTDELQSDIKVFPLGQNNSVEAALKQLVAHGYPAVNVVADNFELDDYLAFANQMDLVIFYDDKKIFAVSSGFNKWKPGGEVIELLSEPAGLRHEGLERTGNLRFKTTRDGFFSLTFDAPFLFIAETV